MTEAQNVIEHEDIQRYEAWYLELQRSLQLIDGHDMENLVTSADNRQLPIHRWFNLKEAYSAHLPLWVLNRLVEKYNATVRRVIDPFVGSGTTGIALASNGLEVCGIEYNPFIHFVAQTKSLYPRLNSAHIIEAMQTIRLAKPRTDIEVPLLSTFSKANYFRQSDIQIILHTISQIRRLDCAESVRSFLLLGVAAAIDDVANLRKDGRALRYVRKDERPRANVAIQTHWEMMFNELGSTGYSGTFTVHRGTAINLDSIASEEPFDLALYSPPYLNNFDYSEIYKLELWMLGFLTTQDEWRLLRKSTVRSHPSVQFKHTEHLQNEPRFQDIATMLEEMEQSESLLGSRTRMSMKGVVTGYFDDMYLALSQQWRVLKPGGFLVYVVANSRHKSLPIATDIILASIAQRIGFEPLELVVLKKRNGRTRQKTYLRESAVFFRKPANT